MQFSPKSLGILVALMMLPFAGSAVASSKVTITSVPEAISPQDDPGLERSPMPVVGSDTVSSTPVEIAMPADAMDRWHFGTATLGSTEAQNSRYPILLAQNEQDEDVNDPLEPLNRAIFQFNEVVYAILLDPLARSYNAYVPDTLRLAIGNFLSHLASPVTFINDLLQLEFERAMTTLGRFVVNTTAGMGGIADVADTIGLDRHEEDFGQTLGAYGVGEGFYLVLPLFGPSNPRDAVGRFLVDPYFDPVGLWFENTDRDAERYSRIGITVLSEYAAVVDELDQVRKTSVDYYAAMRSLYRQRRASLISNGEDTGIPDIPNYDLNQAPADDGSIATFK